MKSYIIVMRDIVANVYTQPETTTTLGGAIRAFGDRCAGKHLAQQPNDVVAAHPEHFEMWVIGEYDDETAKCTVYDDDHRKQIAVGANYKS